MSEDGRRAACRRVADGAVKEKTDKAGAVFYLHKLGDDDWRQESSRSLAKAKVNSATAKTPIITLADAETLDKVYRNLLSRLTLSTEHRAALRHRGLNDDDIGRGQYVTLPKAGRTKLCNELFQIYGETLLSVPGFSRRDRQSSQPYLTLLGPAGLIVPVRDVDGRIIALKVRRDAADIAAANVAGHSDAKYVYLSSSRCGGPGASSPAHVPAGIKGPVDLVRVSEGELKSDIAWAKSGVPTISMPGVGSWRAAMEAAQKLGAKTIRLAFDADSTVNPHVAKPLRDCAEAIITARLVVELERWPAELGKGIDDVLAAGHGDRIEVLNGDAALNAAREIARGAGVPDVDGEKSKNSGDRNDGKKANKSVATKVIELAQATQLELWHTPSGDAFVSIRRDGHIEHWPIIGREFKNWLTGMYYKATGEPVTADAFSSALNLFAAQAMFDGAEHDVFVRVAKYAGTIYLDLCNPSWQAVEVSTEGWRVVENPPVRFRRFRAMLPLPIPEHGGRIGDLRQLINVTDSTWPLVVGWLLGCFRPGSTYPILALFAEQGAGKTTAARLLRSLIDPNTTPLRSEPRNEENLILAANNSWVVAFDNLSNIASWLSDALCRLATGGGFSTRTFYTNDEETIFSVTRPTMLTSIEDIASRSDLLDRCVVAHLPAIRNEQRKTEADLQAAFNEMRPRLLGAILDAVSVGLKREHEIHPERLPRMADFAKWVIACEPGLGWPPGTFLAAYDDNRSEANELALESSVIWKPLSELLADRNEWRGTAGDLKKTLEDRLNANLPKDWPKTPKAFGGAVRRIAPNVRALGWSVSFDEREPDPPRRKIIVIEKAAPRNVSNVSNVSGR